MNKLAVCCAFLLSLPSCSRDKTETNGPAVQVLTTPPVPLLDSASMAVLLAFIRHDSLALSYHTSRSKAISCRALALQVDPPPTHPVTVDELLAPREGFHVGLLQLLTYKRQGKRFFTEQDSLFLLQQAQQQRERTLAPTWFAPADLLLPEQQEHQRQEKRNQEYYLFSQPVFSRDTTRAYLQMDHICPACGSGGGYYLEKKAGRWREVGFTAGWTT